MLKRRIIPVQLLAPTASSTGAMRLVKPMQFGAWRDVGDPVKSSKVYSDQDADELVFLNIDRGERSVEAVLSILARVSEACFMPLSVGGGITSFEDARRLIQSGADKVVVNSAAYRDAGIITRIADAFGTQAVIAAVDVRADATGWRCYSDCGRRLEEVALGAHLDALVNAGAGEVLVTSIDREGTMTGYDLALLRFVAARVPIPVIGHGGAGTYEHMKAAFLETGVDALACASLFNFGDNNPIRAKAHLTNAGVAFKAT